LSTTLASNIQSQDYKYAVQVPQGTWRWTTRVDVSQALVIFEIRDVFSPFGLLRDSIPIPGSVVTAMAGSITDLQTAFAPSIVFAPTSFTFTQDEGRGFDLPQALTISNGGVYGSLLSCSVSADAAFVKVNPASASSLAFNASGAVQVSVDTTTLLAVSSPYSATLTLQDPNATNTPQTVPITIVVRPKAIITLTPTALVFNVACPTTGSFPPVPSQTFNIQNTGPAGSALNFQVQKLIGLSPWLVSYSPTFGELASSASQTITVVVAPEANMQPGCYKETLRVSGYSLNSYQDIPVTLTIT
jgi:hypothetical protein